MHVLSITAGAATMYCGSCLRDNALAAELIKLGHQVTLVPMYTPTLTDEPNVSTGRVFFGGISVYLEQYLPIFRRTPAVLDRLWDSARVIRAFARRSIQVDARFLGEMTVSMLKGEHGHQRKELAKLIAWLKTQPRPDVIHLPYTLLIGLAKPLRDALGAPVCCALQGEDLFLDQLHEPYRSEALRLIHEQVGDVDRFIAVSEYYATYMSTYLRIPADRIRTVRLGIAARDFARADGAEGESASAPADAGAGLTIGYFARVAPEKGLDRLADAYVLLRRERGLPPSRLEAAGYLAAEHRDYLARIERRLSGAGLRDEFQYHGEMDRAAKVRFLRGLDVFSMPAPYHEPKGLSVLEAMASGVPVVQPRHGAFPEMIERMGGGLLVSSDSIESLAEGLWQLWVDRELRDKLGRAAVVGVRTHYGINRMARDTVAVFEDVAAAASSVSNAARTDAHPAGVRG